MEIAKFEQLIGRWESQADKDHRKFRWKVMGIIAQGYALAFLIMLGIALLVAVTLLGRAFLLAIKLTKLGGHFAVGLCRGFWVKPDANTATSLPADRLRPLTELVETVAKDLNAPPVHKVLISSDWNARAYQRPTFGPFGPFKNEVTIGLPLLATLNVDEVRAVVAHEMGHIHRGHSRFGLRVLQISSAWDQAIDEMTKNKVKSGPVIKLFRWYTPRLKAAQHVLSRIAEREANKAQTELTGVQIHVQSRVDAAILTHAWQDCFHAVLKDSFSQDDLPQDFLVQMCTSLQKPLPRETMIERLKAHLDEPYDPFASHPPLSQILREMGVDPSLESVLGRVELPSPDRVCAGETLFGEEWNAFMLEASQAWANSHRAAWQKDREKFVGKQKNLEKLLESVKDREPSESERIDLALRLYGQEEYDEAMRWLEPVKEGSPHAIFTLGLLLRQGKDPDWVRCMEEAAKDPEIKPAAAKMLIEHYTATGERSEVQRVITGVQEQAKFEAKVKESVHQLGGIWAYAPCPWTPDQRASVAEKLAKSRFVKRAYAVGRMADGRFFNCCIVIECGHLAVPDSILQNLAKLKYPTYCYLFAPPKIPDEIKAIEGSLIFDRKLASRKPAA